MINRNLSVTKEFTWDCAHMLADHTGLCKNVHGHTYKLLVTLQRTDELLQEEKEYQGINMHFISTADIEYGWPTEGMIVDFKALKKIVRETIVDKIDHAMIINTNSFDPCEQEIYEILKKYSKKIFPVCYRPTAENMALDFAARINAALKENFLCLRVAKLRLYETPTSYAELEF